jgi:hypothetical protein
MIAALAQLVFWIALTAGVSIVTTNLTLARKNYRMSRPKVRPYPKPICGCEHHASYHDEKGCNHVTISEYNRASVKCGCVKYVGPEVLPEYIP